ncbi:hypothetical protein RCL_jg1215.t1 [Rhizophagus clarus]|uniref:Uncharacterized protein n=1 Tax=Rhizophagus clarus TaxID=94130 RepID=A0A8H3LDH8_9GLOM|nr:hypothetical protein RCL_jg1215.t1 [Rhizophagus clarus]
MSFNFNSFRFYINNLDEEIEAEDVDMDLSDSDLDFILYVTGCVGHMWEAIDDDKSVKATKGSMEPGRRKFTHFR